MNLGLRVPGGATPPLASCAPPLPGIQGPHGHPCWLSCPSHFTTAPHSFSPWCLGTRTAARAHHRAVGSVLWASLEGSIPCQHVVLTAPKGLVRTLDALGPPQQTVGREGLAWIQAGLGGQMARQPLEPVSPGPTRAYPLCSSVPMCACVCEIGGCRRPCSWAALAPGHCEEAWIPSVHSFIGACRSRRCRERGEFGALSTPLTLHSC